MRLLKLSTILLALNSALAAGQSNYATGGSATWGLGSGTRGQAVGSAAGLLAGDATVVGSNPAVLSLLGPEAALHHGQWEQGTSWDQLAVVLPISSLGTIGVASGLASYGKFEGYDDFGNYMGDYEAGEALTAVGVGSRFKELSVGAAFYLTRQTIAKTVDLGYAWDAGVYWKPSPLLGLAGALRSSTEGLANGSWALDLGGSIGGVGTKAPWGLAVNTRLEAESPAELQLAGTRDFKMGPVGLQFLAGWRFLFPQPELGTSYNWSAGLTLGWQAWALDYAFLPTGDYFEPRHHLGLRYLFGGPPQEAPAPKAVPTVVAEAPALPVMPGPTPDLAPALPALPTSTVVAVFSDEVTGGEVLEAKGKYNEALTAYRAGAEKDPGDVQAWKHMAKLYDKLGQPAYGHTCWQQTARLDPADPEAMAALSRP